MLGAGVLNAPQAIRPSSAFRDVGVGRARPDQYSLKRIVIPAEFSMHAHESDGMPGLVPSRVNPVVGIGSPFSASVLRYQIKRWASATSILNIYNITSHRYGSDQVVKSNRKRPILRFHPDQGTDEFA